ncbi:MAG: deoxyribose-phosphate aldolase [Proteobacteria bacterium]|nr:deoxyribose-phosphate aldolase [Pseudomonadota bacterium]MDA1355285.1 deoxyribose-phosphate aldolase [Pseudomonadota bacterium]
MSDNVSILHASGEHRRNPGMEFELEWLEELRINTSAVERRAANIPARRTVKKEWQAAWLLKAISCIDLTTLSGDDTPGRVARLCAKARQPVRREILEALGADGLGLQVGAVCVYHAMIAPARDALAGSGIAIAAVSAGFPAGLSAPKARLLEVEESVAAGADEIDIVIDRSHALRGDWRAIYDEVRAYRQACGPAHLKTIIATGDLATLRNTAKASLVCMMAGADFIKTSTGKEATNATPAVSLVMLRMIRAYQERTGQQVGFKPAGGISTAKGVLGYQFMMKEELGRLWLEPELFRIGASSLLTDIERQLEHRAHGRYAARHRQPMA